MKMVVLSHEADAQGWRERARALLAAGTPPGVVEWRVKGTSEAPQQGQCRLRPNTQTPHCPAQPPAKIPENSRVAPSQVSAAKPDMHVPRAFLTMARWALLNRDPRRFSLLYSILWRMAHGRPELLRLTVDPQVSRALSLARQTSRDAHRMQAFVRFRQLEEPDGHWFCAWYEPDHHVVEAVSPFFAHRFAAVRWRILTPRRSVRWDGQRLVLEPGAARPAWARHADATAAPVDMIESAWLTFYSSHFNAGRVNERLVDKHIPRRFRHNLPEAGLIDTLTNQARSSR